ncbi:MAG: hypothetical protein LUE08_00140, partial [Akkermansiaceae bacterium]|nr:hypothetical protein [Akkermansiaceae bacterium]
MMFDSSSKSPPPAMFITAVLWFSAISPVPAEPAPASVRVTFWRVMVMPPAKVLFSCVRLRARAA